MPASATSGLGVVSLTAPMRVPRPAASTIPRVGRALTVRACSMCSGHQRQNQDRTGASAGVSEIAVEVPPDARQMGEVGGLAIAPREPVEDADDPHRALRTQNGVGRAERRLVEAGRRLQIAHDKRSLQPV